MNYYIIAGEASGDLHGSNLMKSLVEKDPKANFRFWGGDLMAQTGGTLVKHYKELAFMGFAEVVLNLKTILNNIKFCKTDIENFNPDVIIFIDYPGFNLRSTDLQAFIGLEQLKKLDMIVKNRNKNFLRYKNEIKNPEWNIQEPNGSFVSNFSFPIITKNITKLVEELTNNHIECRPLICGSINEHPFWYERYGHSDLPKAKRVHEYGIYLPNNHEMTEEELNKVIEIVNNNL